MIGHMKTISILVGGFILFQDNLNFKQFIGILLTLFGLFSYTFVRMREQNQLPCTRWNINPTAIILFKKILLKIIYLVLFFIL